MFSYFLPYELYHTVILQPVYELEPVVPPAQAEGETGQQPAATGGAPADSARSAAAASAADNAATPDDVERAKDRQLVYKGAKWVAVPVYLMRENVYYNLWQDMIRDEDQERAIARKAATSRRSPEAPAGDGVESGGVQPGGED